MIVWKIFDGTSLLRSGWARQNWSLSCLNGLTKCLCWKNKVLSHDLLFPLSAVRGLRGFVTGLIAWENFYVLHRSSGVALRRHRHFEQWTKQLLTMPNSDFSCGRNTFFFGSRHCAAVLFSQVPKKCTDLDLSLLYILTLGTYSKFARENNFLALSVCFPKMLASKHEDRFLDPFWWSGTKKMFGPFFVPALHVQFLSGPAKHAKDHAEVPEDTCMFRVPCLWFLTSDHLKSWLILSVTTRWRQLNESTIVWRNLSLYHLFQCLLPLCHAVFVWKTRQSTRGGGAKASCVKICLTSDIV